MAIDPAILTSTASYREAPFEPVLVAETRFGVRFSLGAYLMFLAVFTSVLFAMIPMPAALLAPAIALVHFWVVYNTARYHVDEVWFTGTELVVQPLAGPHRKEPLRVSCNPGDLDGILGQTKFKTEVLDGRFVATWAQGGESPRQFRLTDAGRALLLKEGGAKAHDLDPHGTARREHPHRGARKPCRVCETHARRMSGA